MVMAYEVVRYTPEFRDQVIALDRHLVGPDAAMNAAYFRWKHEDNPYLDAPILFLAVSGGRVVGKRAFLGARWQTGEDDGTAPWLCACDLVVDPAHRGQKLFQRITAFALPALAAAGHHRFLNWSASPISYRGFVQTGWSLVGPYRRWALRTPRARAVADLHGRMRRMPVLWRHADRFRALALGAGFAALDAAWAARGAGGGMAVEAAPRPDAMARLAARSAGARIRHVRDAGYFRWRFANPAASYRFAFAPGADPEGFMVLQTSRTDPTADVAIVDWEAASPDALAGMLSALAGAGGYDSLSMWTATLDAAVVAALRRLGFAPTDDSRGDPAYRPGLLAFHADGGGAPDRAHFGGLDRWDLRMAYSDYY